MDFLDAPESQEAYEITVDEIAVMAMEDLDIVLRAILNLDNTGIPESSTIFFIRPLGKGKAILRTTHVVSVPTTWLSNKLLKALDLGRAVKKAEFFHTLSGNPRTRSSAGWIFESVIHEHLVRSGSINVKWYDETESSPQVLQLPSSSNTYSDLADLHSAAPFYWRAENLNNSGIDAAIVTEDHVYVIQATISRTQRDPQQGVDSLWRSMPRDKKELKWKLLFAGSAESQTKEVSAPYAHNLMVGDVKTGGTVERGGIQRVHLPVGWFTLFPDALDTMLSVS